VRARPIKELLFIYCVMALCSLGLAAAIGATVYYILTRWPYSH